MPIRLAIAEDDYLLREGMVRLLEAEPEIEVVAACDSFDSVVEAVRRYGPDVVLTDIRMPPTNTDEGIRLAKHLRVSHPEIGVVVLSQFVESAYAVALLEGGSQRRAYLVKERISEVDELVNAVRSVAEGRSVIDQKVVDALVAPRAEAKSPLRFLTQRELDVLSEIARGRNNAAIAATLDLSSRAVEKHISAIFSKLCLTDETDVNRRVAAVLVYLHTQASSPH